MKKLLVLLLAMTMLFALAACGGDEAPAESAAPAESEAPAESAAPAESETPAEPVIMKIALVTDVGTIDDESFNQGTWEGVVAYAEANNVEHEYYQPTADTNDARAASIVQAITEGADVIVMPGFLFGQNVIDIPPQYPDVHFIALDIDQSNFGDGMPAENLTCITFSEEQAGWLAGYAAVKDGYTQLGYLGGMAVPAVVRFGYGYIQGADYAAQEMGTDIAINYTYGGQFFGDASITAKMEGWYSSGTEVVFACGGGIWTSAVEAALGYEGMVIGVDSDQHYLGETDDYAYNPFLTSAVKLLPNATANALSELAAGNWANYGGMVINYSLAEGDFVGIPTAEESWEFETFTMEEYEAAIAMIIDGTIVIDPSADTETYPTVSESTTLNIVA